MINITIDFYTVFIDMIMGYDNYFLFEFENSIGILLDTRVPWVAVFVISFICSCVIVFNHTLNYFEKQKTPHLAWTLCFLFMILLSPFYHLVVITYTGYLFVELISHLHKDIKKINYEK